MPSNKLSVVVRAGRDKSQDRVGVRVLIFFISSFALKIIGKAMERKEQEERDNDVDAKYFASVVDSSWHSGIKFCG